MILTCYDAAMLDEAQARRLARAICSDVLLYNEGAKSAPAEQRAGLLAQPVQEGRALFASRVPPELQFIFEQTVDELIARPLGVDVRAIFGNATAAPMAQPQPTPRIGAPVAETRSATPLLVVAVLLVLAAALGFFLLK